MKTTLTGKNGEKEEFEGLLPSVNAEERTVDLIDEECLVIVADISFDDLQILTFEP